MTARIWPGALCYLARCVRSENNGRVVTAMRRVQNELWLYPGGAKNIGPGWVIDRDVTTWGGARSRRVPEYNLTPILPPPGSESTEDRAPCEVEPAQPDRVSA